MTGKRYYVNCAGYLCDKELSNTLSIFECADLLNEQEERIKELEQELQNLQTFKKVLEFAEKDMEERADWQAYCEKEFEGL